MGGRQGSEWVAGMLVVEAPLLAVRASVRWCRHPDCPPPTAAGKRLETVPDPTQIHYHLPASSRHPNVRRRFCWLPPGCCRLCWGALGCRAGRCAGRLPAPAWRIQPPAPCLPSLLPPPPLPPRAQGWQVKVWRDYERFIADLTALFPHERAGIRALYDEFWKVGAGLGEG